MTNKRYFLLVGILAFISFVGVSCSVSDNHPSTSIPPIMVSVTPSMTPLPTLIPMLIVPTRPTPIPYPTATTVQANAVAFIGRDNSNSLDTSLWVANVDGSGERKLTDIEENAEGTSKYILKWSPDGKWISYISNNEVWIISPDGSDKKKVLGSFEKNKCLISYHWSPDSSMIAYIQVTLRDAKFDSESIRVLNLKTGETYELSTHKPQPYGTILRWSPNGLYLVFNQDASFVIFDIANQKAKKEILTDNTNCSSRDNTGPYWSPNSEWFFHIHSAAAHYTSFYVCISKLDGSTHRVELDGTILSDVVWNKAGNLLYFVVGRVIRLGDSNLDRNPQLQVYDVRTQKLEHLFSLEEGDGWSVSISPDGRTLETHTQLSDDQKSYILIDSESLATEKFTSAFGCEWSIDSHDFICLSGANGYSSFYRMNIQTRETIVFSGAHSIVSWVISPITTSP